MGDRRQWLSLDPRETRSWAMLPHAISLGLTIPLSFTPKELPVRMQIPKPPFEFQTHMVYIGQGHHTHRKRVSVWSSPYTTGAHGTDEEVLILYSNWLTPAV